MCNTTCCRILVMALSLMLVAPALHALDAEAIVERADQLRLAHTRAKVVTEVMLYKEGALEKRRLYHVFIQPGQRSLVLFKSPMERGQKVLMLKEKFWLLMPKSRRPIRITPMQKLLGDASTGDIATMTWSEYYSSEILSGSVMKNGVETIHLNLVTQSKAATYARIELWVEKEQFAPVSADLFVKSGKLAKQAHYTLAERDGKRQVVEIELLDRIQKNRRTVVKTLEVIPQTLPEKYYNPQFLVRNPKLSL